MRTPPHIVIIGAGLIGLSAADHLAQRGAKITVIDRRSGPGLGASFANSAMIHPSQAWPWLEGDFKAEAQAVFKLAMRSQYLLARRMRALGVGRHAGGSVQLFDNKETALRAQARYVSLGAACLNITGQPKALGRHALFFPEDMSGNAYDYCRAMATDLARRGARFVYNCTDIPEGDEIVIAAGTGSAAVAQTYGFELPINPVRGHALNFKKPETKLPACPVMHYQSRSALTVFPDHLRLSGTVNEASPYALLDIWGGLVPDIISQLEAPLSVWSEDRPVSLLGRPIITQLRSGLWVSCGHAHMGWTLSAGSGELLAQMIYDKVDDKRFALA